LRELQLKLRGTLITLLVLNLSPAVGQENEGIRFASEVTNLLLRACLATGEVAEINKEGDAVRLTGHQGSIELRFSGVIGGISKEMTDVQSRQTDKARSCMQPYIPQILSYLSRDQPGNNHNLPANPALKGVSVVYYTKEADRGSVVNALEAAKIHYSLGLSSKPQNYPSVSIACTSDVSAGAIKELAHALQKKGVSLRLIDRIRTPSNPSSTVRFAK
jgi:hypothetical protein